MMKKLIFVCLLSLSFLTNYGFAEALSSNHSSCPTCPLAKPSQDPGFCPTFKTAAVCHCTSSGLPSGMCQDVNFIYRRMISMFGTVQRACEYQKETSVQECIDGWHCYREGGSNSSNKLCSGTGKACE